MDALATFRTAHIGIVARYIIAQQRAAARGGGGAATGAAMDAAAKKMTAAIQAKGGLGAHAGGKGTGGTGIMTFLKPTRDETEARRLA